MLYSYNNEYPIEIPDRIRLSDGSTRTDSSTFTDTEIADAGYVSVSDPPSYDSSTHKLTWTGTAWQVVALTTDELNTIQSNLWSEVRKTRDNMIQNVEWRIMRYQSEVRLGITTTTDSISDLDTYVQELRDITDQSDPSSITWPAIGGLASSEDT